MGCFQTRSHSIKAPLPNPYVQNQNNRSSLNVNQSKHKRIAQYAINNKIQSILKIIQDQIPFELVKQLNISNCIITQISMIECFVALEYLAAANNQLQKISGLQSCRALTSLNLSYNKITVIDNLFHLVELRHLYLNNNEIKSIKNLYTLRNLIELALGSNQIKNIKRLEKLVNLEILGLEINRISKIQNLEQLKNLKLLMLGGNFITKIDGISALDSLQILYLQNNFIQKIQNIYSEIDHLKEVRLEYNLINGVDQAFVVGMILKGGVNVIVGQQKTAIQKYMPNFIASLTHPNEFD